jgi:uncharacterized protein YjbJ (UPF0337 family)
METVAGKVKEKWGKLTDDDLTTINGQRTISRQTPGTYGMAKDQAEKQIDEFSNTLAESGLVRTPQGTARVHSFRRCA